jgi:diguanylate cyclase (GGDEF)-like protein
MLHRTLQDRFTRLMWQVMFVGVGVCALAYGIFQGLDNPRENGLTRILLVMVWIVLCRLVSRQQAMWGAGVALFGVLFALPFLIDDGIFNNTFSVLSIATLPSLLLTMLLGWQGAILVACSSMAVLLLKSSDSIEATVMGWVILFATTICGALIHRLMRDIDRANARLEQTAMTDALTKLGNRFALDMDFDKLYGSGILAIWDVNGLKQVNDQKGHLAGDAYLLEFVAAFQSQSNAKFYRVGGDEFVSLHTPDTNLPEVYHNVRHHFFHVSAGWESIEARDLDTVLNHADKAMYLEKAKRTSLLNAVNSGA